MPRSLFSEELGSLLARREEEMEQGKRVDAQNTDDLISKLTERKAGRARTEPARGGGRVSRKATKRKSKRAA